MLGTQFYGGDTVTRVTFPVPSLVSLVGFTLLTGVLLFCFQTSLDSLGQRERAVFGD